MEKWGILPTSECLPTRLLNVSSLPTPPEVGKPSEARSLVLWATRPQKSNLDQGLKPPSAGTPHLPTSLGCGSQRCTGQAWMKRTSVSCLLAHPETKPRQAGGAGQTGSGGHTRPSRPDTPSRESLQRPSARASWGHFVGSSPSWPGERLLKNPDWRRPGDRPLLPSHCTRSAPSQDPAQGSSPPSSWTAVGMAPRPVQAAGGLPTWRAGPGVWRARSPSQQGLPRDAGPRAWGASQGWGDCLLGNLHQRGNHRSESPKVGPGRGRGGGVLAPAPSGAPLLPWLGAGARPGPASLPSRARGLVWSMKDRQSSPGLRGPAGRSCPKGPSPPPRDNSAHLGAPGL